MNYDLAVVLCLADEGKNRPFDEYVAGIVGRMLEKCPKEKAFLEQFSLHYYLADNKSDTSIAEWLMRLSRYCILFSRRSGFCRLCLTRTGC